MQTINFCVLRTYLQFIIITKFQHVFLLLQLCQYLHVIPLYLSQLKPKVPIACVAQNINIDHKFRSIPLNWRNAEFIAIILCLYSVEKLWLAQVVIFFPCHNNGANKYATHDIYRVVDCKRNLNYM